MMYLRLFLFLLISVPVVLKAQITGPLPPSIFNSISQNSISNIGAFGDTLWIGPSLQFNVANGFEWIQPTGIDSITNGPGRVFALSLSQDTVVVGLGFTSRTQGQNVDGGFGFYLSTDGGQTFTFRPFPLESRFDTRYDYGNNNITQLPVTVREQSPPYEVAHKGSTVMAVAWASGLLRSMDFGQTWHRVILPPSSIDTLRPERTYNFVFNPLIDTNFLGFGLFIDSKGQTWVGTAGGINISPNATFADRSQVIWYHQRRDVNISNSLLGEWIVAIKEHVPTETVFMTNWAARTGDRFGLVSTDDNGRTFRHYLIGEQIYDFDFQGDYIFAAGRNGLFISPDLGTTWNHLRQIRSANTFIKSSAVYYSVALAGNRMWIGTSDGLASTDDLGETWSISRVNYPLSGGNRFQQDTQSVDTYAYPNPFSARIHQLCRIRFDVPGSQDVKVTLFDFGMNRIRQLDSRALSAGSYEAVWDGTDELGRFVANGVVFYVVEAGNKNLQGKILVIN